MLLHRFFYTILVSVVFLVRCSEIKKTDDLKEMVPAFIKDSVYLSADNIFTKEKAALGRYLFYDRRLSANNTKACASCHAQEFSFTDSYNRSIGALGDLHQRNSRPLINLIFNKYLTGSDSSLRLPEDQIVRPMFNIHPAEMGWAGNENNILEKIKKEPVYRKLFKKAFSKENDPVTIKNIQYSIASFIKTLFSYSSAYDQYYFQNKHDALNASQKKGMQLFFSDSLKCGTCHGGINFNTPALQGEKTFYFNTGLYNINNTGSYPAYDRGLIEITDNPDDMGKYRIPTLRNLVFTAPYFHDGSEQALENVIAVYENGGRRIDTGVYRGDGRNNPFKTPLISGFRLNSQQRKDLINFLLSLTDSSVINNPAYANPFTEDETRQ